MVLNAFMFVLCGLGCFYFRCSCGWVCSLVFCYLLILWSSIVTLLLVCLFGFVYELGCMYGVCFCFGFAVVVVAALVRVFCDN